MTLNLIANRAAAVANRKLGITSAEVTNSVRKLSSGTRVESARDDAASMAIGSRLKSELAALKQVSLNATQAVSLLQIGEGAIGRVQDMLVRLKALATQAGSGNLSNGERELLDVEYQQLTAEIDRITGDTQFNGQQLVAATQTVTGALIGTNGILEISANNVVPSNPDTATFDEFRVSYVAATQTFTVESYLAGAATGQQWTATIAPSNIDAGGQVIAGTSLKFTPNAAAVTAHGDDSFFTSSINNNTAAANAFDATANIAAAAGTAIEVAGSNLTTKSFKVGTGSDPTQDQITIALQGVSVDALGLANSSIAELGLADAANAAIDLALDTVIVSRAQVGSTQNRVEATAINISITQENIDAARSAYLDLNVAEEISTFTAKQVLQQAGVSIAAQANSLPQNLLQLFQ